MKKIAKIAAVCAASLTLLPLAACRSGEATDVVVTGTTDFEALVSDKVTEAVWEKAFDLSSIENVTVVVDLRDYKYTYSVADNIFLDAYDDLVDLLDVGHSYQYKYESDAWTKEEFDMEPFEKASQYLKETLEIYVGKAAFGYGKGLADYYSQVTYDNKAKAYVGTASLEPEGSADIAVKILGENCTMCKLSTE